MSIYEWRDEATRSAFAVEEGEDRVLDNGAVIWGTAPLGREIRRLVDRERELLELVSELAEENARLKEGAQLVLAGFDAGVFVRDVSGDNQLGWAMKMVQPMRGLAVLSAASREPTG